MARSDRFQQRPVAGYKRTTLHHTDNDIQSVLHLHHLTLRSGRDEHLSRTTLRDSPRGRIESLKHRWRSRFMRHGAHRAITVRTSGNDHRPREITPRVSIGIRPGRLVPHQHRPNDHTSLVDLFVASCRERRQCVRVSDAISDKIIYMITLTASAADGLAESSLIGCAVAAT